MRTAKPKPIFRGLTIAAVGDLRRENGSDQWTDPNITRWVTLREGRFVRLDPHAANLSTEVTHVICSEEEFRRRGLLGECSYCYRCLVVHMLFCEEGGRERDGGLLTGCIVKKALRRGRACQIVTLDWLEDCMSASQGKGKRLREEEYSFRRVLEKERQREKRRLEGIKGEEKGVKGVNTSRSLLVVCFAVLGVGWSVADWFRSLPSLSRPYVFSVRGGDDSEGGRSGGEIRSLGEWDFRLLFWVGYPSQVTPFRAFPGN
jgi:hypothetical protein